MEFAGIMDESIRKMTHRIASVMGGSINSIWLYGSVVLKDFRLGWSDIDFLVLTEGEITESQAQELLMLRQTMLEEEPDNPYYRSFEGVIVSLPEYLSGRYTRLVYWGTSGQRITDDYRMDVFSAYELAEYGRCVFGKADCSIFRNPSRSELVDAVREHYESILRYARETNEQLYSCGWLLDIARCIYTVRYGEVISKTQAGMWALRENLFEDESALRTTLAIRQNPAEYKERAEIKEWLCKLGPVVQQYADVLEIEVI